MIRTTLTRAAVAIGAAATLVVLGAGSANAAVVDPFGADISLGTTITFASDTLDIEADAAFTSNFVENTTVALQVVGTETWTDATGTHTTQLTATPSSVQFSPAAKVSAFFNLHHDAVVQVTYTAEAVGAAPTPFFGSCAGTGVQLSSSQNTSTKTC